MNNSSALIYRNIWQKYITCFAVEFFINASILIFQKRELYVGGFGGFTLYLSLLMGAFDNKGQYLMSLFSIHINSPILTRRLPHLSCVTRNYCMPSCKLFRIYNNSSAFRLFRNCTSKTELLSLKKLVKFSCTRSFFICNAFFNSASVLLNCFMNWAWNVV